ncbi:MAG: polysaccharide deacetylase family protein [Eubacteriales bacterium]
MKFQRIFFVTVAIVFIVALQDIIEIEDTVLTNNSLSSTSVSSTSVLNDVDTDGHVQNLETKKIALTFDDGPSDMDGGTEYLLDGLLERGVKATFFVLGERAEVNPIIMSRIVDEGHLIGNHTYSHIDLSILTKEQLLQELEKTNEIVKELTGVTIEYMRPPYGAWDKEQEEWIDMIPVLWTIDSLDWATNNVEEIVNKVVTEAEENDIILMHDCYKSSSEAAFQIIDILQNQGFEFVTVEELLID